MSTKMRSKVFVIKKQTKAVATLMPVQDHCKYKQGELVN